jgi:hypothetical protein
MADEIKVKLVADVEVNKQKIAADIQQGIQQGASAAGGKGIRLSQISNLPEHIRKQLLASGQVEEEPIDQRAMERSRAAIERSISRVREAQGKSAVGAAAVQREMRQGKIARDETFAADIAKITSNPAALQGEKILQDQAKEDAAKAAARMASDRDRANAKIARDERFNADIARIRGGGANEKINKLFRDQQKEDAAFAARYAKLHPTPPVIPPPVIPKTFLEKFLGNQGLGSKFLQYQIGRAGSEALGAGPVLSRLVGSGMAAGGAQAAAKAIAALGPVGITVAGALVGVGVAARAVKKAFEILLPFAQQGSKLYEQSRAIGRPTEQTSSYLKTLGSVGIEESMAMRLAAYGQFGRGRGAGGGGLRGSVAGEMIAAGRASGMSIQELQQIANMSKEIEEAWRQTRLAAIATANVAYQNFRTIMAWKIFENDFRAFWQQMSGIFGGVVESVLKIGHALMQVVNTFAYLEARMLQGFRTIAEFMAVVTRPLIGNPASAAFSAAAALLPRSDPGDPHRIGGFTRDTHFSSLERMGLVIGGHQDKSTKYLERIAQNTGRMADRLQAVLGGGREHGSIGRQQPPHQDAAALAGSIFQAAGGLFNLP